MMTPDDLITTQIPLLKTAIDAWQLQPTATRHEIAKRVMEMLTADNDCNGTGGAANATAALCLALAEIIVANTIPCNWDVFPDRVRDRIQEEIERINH